MDLTALHSMLTTLCCVLMVVAVVCVAGQEDSVLEAATLEPVAEARVASDNTTNLSPAEELIMAAKAAGYELTLDRLDQAGAATDEEVEELMPPPVAEAFISYRRMDNFDIIREKMIGMVFTGKPQPLGPRTRYPPMRPPPRHNPHSRFHVQYNPQGEASIQHTQKVLSPQEILKPLSFEPGPTTVKFPSHRAPPPSRQTPGRPSFPPVEDFSNTVGPDFGPVTFSEFGGNNFGFQNNFKNEFDFDTPNPPPRPAPSRPPPSRPPPSRPPPHSSRPPPHSAPSRPGPRPPPPRQPPRPGPTRHRPRPGGFSNGGFGGMRGGNCVKYTEDICLDTEEYPHEAILSSLVRDPSRADNMVAEVRAQSADELVDGVSATQEGKYDYQHYFGNRRAGTESHVHRDFAQDGGFLCPSEVKYARPKRARNSKGKWKYIVNMDKYSQTIRMEKCLKPGGACSYVSHHYRATCNQVYNYHRLLSWEDGRGLHMDIFKVPSCCSCHIQGYAYIFPPLGRHINSAGSSPTTHVVEAPTDQLDLGAANEEPGFSPSVKPGRRRPVQRSPGSRRPASPLNHPGSDLRSRTQRVEEPPQQSSHPPQRDTRNPPPRAMSPRDVPQRGPGLPRDLSQYGQRSQSPSRPSRRPADKVNYGYHPIIDFFGP